MYEPIKSRSVAGLDYDGLSALQNVMGHMTQHSLDAQGVLDFHWAAKDAGIVGGPEWYLDLRREDETTPDAKAMWDALCRAANGTLRRKKARGKRTGKCPTCGGIVMDRFCCAAEPRAATR